jgi:protease I
MPAIANSKILIMATHGFEESELLKPLEELGSKGAIVHVASPEVGGIKGWWHKDWGKFVPVDLTLDAVVAKIVDEVEDGPHKRGF